MIGGPGTYVQWKDKGNTDVNRKKRCFSFCNLLLYVYGVCMVCVWVFAFCCTVVHRFTSTVSLCQTLWHRFNSNAELTDHNQCCLLIGGSETIANANELRNCSTNRLKLYGIQKGDSFIHLPFLSMQHQ